jgi:iron complex outermembrane recepter protein
MTGVSLGCLLLCAGLAVGQSPPDRIEGTVLDAARAPVAGALVRLDRGGSPDAAAMTDSQGRFALELPKESPASAFSLRVEAKGYLSRIVRIELGRGPVEIVLSLAAFSEKVAVVAARRPARLSETPGSVASLSAEDLAETAALALDESLRQVPGFTLFRRNGSRTANPTTQGASLRGIGGSGASRAAVLDDGIPLNDPFGGWVSWGRVPLDSLERVEVLRGGGSSLYGGPALAGAIALFRREPVDSWAVAEASYGSLNTPEASAAVAGRLGPWSARLAAEAFRTDGYIAVPPEERGPVDSEFSSRHDTIDLTLEHGSSSASRGFLRGSYFTESRGNGTPLQVNDTEIWQAAAGVDAAVLSGEISARAYGMGERYKQTFSAVSADRKTETLTRTQRVPSDAWGVNGQWSGAFSAHRLVAGLEGREVSGSSEENVFSGAAVSIANVHGKQATGGLFAEDTIALAPAWSVAAGVRLDTWRNFDARREAGPSAGPVVTTDLADRSESAVSPRLSVLFGAGPGITLSASVYRSFRAPTLNELYRTFRVGNTVTQANEDLGAERLTGGEAASLWTFAGGRGSARAGLFWMEISDPIANVTVSSTPALITRRRANLGRTRSRGVELDGAFQLAPSVEISLGYLYADSTVVENPANRALEGLRVAQVPAHQGTFRIAWRPGAAWVVAVSGRAATNQFEDDENSLPLGPMAVFDALVEAPILPGLSVFAAGENLLDRRYSVARTPFTNLGQPRMVRGGVRLRLGRVES